MTEQSHNISVHGEDIAIVGMAVNVPGAQTVAAFWDNLRDGVSSIRKLTEEELLAAGETPQNIARKNYVRAAADLKGFETFDADFFGFSPKDAAILDPQHRKFLEVAWEAMEQAGHVPENVAGPIGVYAGCGMGSYFYFNICSNPDLVDDVGMFLLRHTGNDKDFLSTRVSHVFDLKGPSINLQTACSTSLVAIHYAAAALRAGEVDMALAGGVTIELPQGRGYVFKENEILSPDGECHAFDHRAQGTVFGSGAGCVALKRLSDAQADGDHIWAVIKGSAINNDGAAKAGYLAPSVDGQAEAIGKALDASGVAADQIELVECHGTGTYLGDPIEVAALTEAYRTQTDKEDYARIGSVKTNIGHLDTAAGVAGLVKATLALHNDAMPASLGFEAPNPAIGFEGSPFSVNDKLTPWPRRATPRYAAINALGVGGTNAHAILGEAPLQTPSEESDFPFHALCISGRSKAALDANTAALAAHLRAHPEQDLADVAHTLKNGRRGFERRRVVVAETHEEAATLLEAGDTRRVFTHQVLGVAPEVVFMFPGGGAQYPDMARDLYETEPAFAEAMDRGLDHLAPQLDYDIRALWLPEGDKEAAAETLKKPSAQLPLIAIVEYALAQLWMSWGVKPAAMVGHSMGENVAACLAGVMTFENLIDLVLLRGRLFDTVPAGGMLSVPLSLEATKGYLGDDLDIASVNGPELTAVSGPDAALQALAERLAADDVESQRIAIDIAAHSRMLEPILNDYRTFLRGLDLKAPSMAFMSNRTGVAITPAQATSPDYWVEQLRNTVNFADCIDTLSQEEGRVFLEVGPGKALSSLAQMCPAVKPAQVLSSLRHPDQDIADDMYFMGIIGRLWACGVEADWDQIWGEARRNRVVLPTYQFQRSPYFIEPSEQAVAERAPEIARIDDVSEWGAVPSWRAKYADVDADIEAALTSAKNDIWLIFADADGVAQPAIERLRATGAQVSVVQAADSFADMGDGQFTLAPEQGREGYDALMAALVAAERTPTRIAHFWGVTREQTHRPGSSFYDRMLEQGFYSLLWLGQTLAELEAPAPIHLSVFTNGATQVASEPLPYPEKAMISGPAGVMPHEISDLTVSTIDLVLPELAEPKGVFARRAAPEVQIDVTGPVLEELLATPENAVVALRDGRRFVQSFRSQKLATPEAPSFKQGGTYLITGGFGGIGQTIAADLLASYGARVILLSRSALPARKDWDRVLATTHAGDATARRIRAVQSLEALGGRVEVAAGDVVNVAQMRKVIDGLLSQGPIDGVIHAAGVLDDAPLLGKTQAQVDAVLAPKVQGLRVLDQLLPDGTVDLMVLFASTSTATRAAGQVDYVAANEYLNAFAKSRAAGDTRVVAVNWGVWADVGMAAEAVGHAPVESLPPRKLDAPLLDTIEVLEGETRFATTLHAKSDWVLDQHRMADGTAVMPGTGMVEAFAQAARNAGLDAPFALRDLYFLRAFEAPEGAPRTMRLSLERQAEGFSASLLSDCVFEGQLGWQIHAETLISNVKSDAQSIDLEAISSKLGAVQEHDGAHMPTPQEAHLNFGPQWQVLRARQLGDGQGLARLMLEAPVEAGQILHPGLMDLATGWAVELASGYDGADLWVPMSYGEITVYEALPTEIYSLVKLSASGEDNARFDVTICDASGKVLVEVRDFAMTRLAGGFAAQSAPLSAAEVSFDAEPNAEPTTQSEAEERLAYMVSQGITAAEGPKALARALAADVPQVYVSSLPLQALIEQADTPPRELPKGQSFERTDLEGFVEPQGPVQIELAQMWSTLLGVSPVGADDSFFDLGGHSLIAVRLFAAVKREFGVEFPISVLFEAPTIADIAARITAQTGEVPVSGNENTKDQPAGFTHLVPLNGVNPSGASPLFVVAGMFGNVLNLRHLALQFADTRAVFGLQARGLIGDSEPHETIEEAAADYIAEIRQVQPHGPYLLSGFSGGGITAYEMARQLKADGETVAVLALLDTPLPVRPSLGKLDKALIKIAEFRQKGPRYLVEWVQNRIAWEKSKRAGKAEEPVGAQFNNTKIEAAFLNAVGQYQTPDWQGEMTLLRPVLDRKFKVSGGNWVSDAREYVFADNEWTQYAPKVTVIEVPGDHDSMVLSPNVVVMASELREIIADALAADLPQQATAAE
ncbi:type I polyketide synthase [Sulfitobacter donghicola]|uniref:Phenolphthiocerol/phthiocerol polyketide synthase subunit E n=1 Tax=Sulfitobacter donghicola DSW-25 = KCTC 12864 = JCM 14565 TaxID=1300350 RepID=A0A073IV37_9RHOB|nr:type I polyketide synthase [Sulfitobacter donghicola]KEJ89257.1 polyketide synthase [Sulfitobacter donghicola DSW-25 = KCTC 12864 = JCM 14565]KIN69053.1 Non-ribosomal peptide synthase [Sulfitobacter donghicola DSW-25 = KCTC 12864 = JCM 14565]